MATVEVRCRNCGSLNVRRQGYTEQGKQRYLCEEKNCGRSFILDYTYNAHKPGVKQQIIKMAKNGMGVRETARVLNISTNTVLHTRREYGL